MKPSGDGEANEAMKRALEHPGGDVFFMDPDWMEEAVRASRGNARRRIMAPIQRSGQVRVQRLVNVMQPGSYVCPHRHPGAEAAELACVLRGRLAVWIFDPDGGVRVARELRPGAPGCLVDLEPGVWHTFAALEPDTVVLEIKAGPYDPETDKEFAAWAPAEGSAGSAGYLEGLMGRLVG